MGLDSQKIIRTARLSLTCLLLFIITWYYQVPESAWCLITIWFVMFEYTTVGGVYTKSFLRFSGTFLSAFYGMVVVYFCANNPLINMMALVPGLFIYAYFFMSGDKTYIGTIGAVTLTIVLLNYNNVDVAILRVFNIIIGILGSVFMIRFFYPQYARDSIIGAHWDFIELLSGTLEGYFDPSKSVAIINEDYFEFEHKMLEGFVVFNRLVAEAKMETKGTPLFITYNMEAFLHIRHLFRLFSVFINYLITENLRLDARISNNLRQLLLDLRAIQRKLEQAEPKAKQNTTMKLEKSVDTPIDATNQYVEIILTNMHKEVALFDEEIKKIVLIYKTYRIIPNNVIAPVEI